MRCFILRMILILMIFTNAFLPAMLYLTAFIPKAPTRKGGFMPFSQSTPLHLWAFSLEGGVITLHNPKLVSANLADAISDFLRDHYDGVIFAVIPDPTDAEIAHWEQRTSDAYWAAEKAKRLR